LTNKENNFNNNPILEKVEISEFSDSIKNTNTFYGIKNSNNNDTDFKKGNLAEKNIDNYDNNKEEKNNFGSNNDYNNNYYHKGKKDFRNKNQYGNYANNNNNKNFNKNNYQKKNNNNNNDGNKKFEENFDLKKPVFTNSRLRNDNKEESPNKRIDNNKSNNNNNNDNNNNNNHANNFNNQSLNQPFNINEIKNTNPNFSINLNESLTISNNNEKNINESTQINNSNNNNNNKNNNNNNSNNNSNSNQQENKNKEALNGNNGNNGNITGIHIQDLLNKEPEEINNEIINSKKTEMENCIRGLSNMNLKNAAANINQNLPSNPLPHNMSMNQPNFNYMIPNSINNNINNINNLQNIQINNLAPVKGNLNISPNLHMQNPNMANMHVPMGLNPMMPYGFPPNPNVNVQFNNFQHPQHQQQHLKNYLAFPHMQNYNQMYYPPMQMMTNNINNSNQEIPKFPQYQIQGQMPGQGLGQIQGQIPGQGLGQIPGQVHGQFDNTNLNLNLSLNSNEYKMMEKNNSLIVNEKGN
jgi:hypothetical protein